MNKDETEKLLILVRGNWTKQSLDEATITIWSQILGRLKFYQAYDAAMAFIRDGRPEAPTAGEIYKQAMGLGAEAAERARYGRKALPPPDITPEQKEKNLQFLRELRDKLATHVRF